MVIIVAVGMAERRTIDHARRYPFVGLYFASVRCVPLFARFFAGLELAVGPSRGLLVGVAEAHGPGPGEELLDGRAGDERGRSR